MSPRWSVNRYNVNLVPKIRAIGKRLGILESTAFACEMLYRRAIGHQLLCSEQEKGRVHMNNSIRIWKDETNHQSLLAEGQVMLPADLAGEIELTDAALEAIHGAGINDPDVINVPNNVLQPHNVLDPLGDSRNHLLRPTEGNVAQTSTYATSSSTDANKPASLVVIPPISLV